MPDEYARCNLDGKPLHPEDQGVIDTFGTYLKSMTGERDIQQEVADRRVMCEKIAAAARRHGLDTDHLRVNRQYKVWLRWYRGQLTTGYLKRMTGVKDA
jgi:hypothetical protein